MNQVLVVDDEPAMRAALEASFRRSGWRVESAGGCVEAIAKFRRSQHALVITDIRMGDGDGFSVMRQVRTLAPHTAVILLTAFGSVPDAVTAMRDGACDYIRKPFTADQVKEHVIPVLGGK